MTNSKELIQDDVMNAVENIETNPHYLDHEDNILEIKVRAGIDGTVNEIIAVLTTGGPHIEVRLFDATVDGWWNVSSHSVPIMDDEAEAALNDLAEYYTDYWENNILA